VRWSDYRSRATDHPWGQSATRPRTLVRTDKNLLKKKPNETTGLLAPNRVRSQEAVNLLPEQLGSKELRISDPYQKSRKLSRDRAK
jgi:hypothetical protein